MPVTTLLIFKLTLVPAIVGIVAWAGKRWGSSLAGVLSGLPIVAGPILFFLYWQQGAAFAISAAQSTVLGIAALASFCVVYARCAQRFSWLLSLGLAWLAFLCFAVALGLTAWGLFPSILFTLIGIVVAFKVLPKAGLPSTKVAASLAEIALRVLFAVFLVLLITGFSNNLGSRFSGLFSAFPVASSVLAVFTHRNHSAAQVVYSLRGVLIGSLGLLVFCVALVGLAAWVTFLQAFVLAVALVLLSQMFLAWIFSLMVSRSVNV